MRPVRADDAEAVHKFLEALSPDSIGYRFFGAPNLDWATQWSVDIEHTVTQAGRRVNGLIVQPMAPAGVELIVGVVHDRSFGLSSLAAPAGRRRSWSATLRSASRP